MKEQPEALRLADHLEQIAEYDSDLQVAAELRRLHEVNVELVEALHLLVVAVDKHGLSTEFQRLLSKADYALAKATGEQHG